jgi:hypothetical protein
MRSSMCSTLTPTPDPHPHLDPTPNPHPHPHPSPSPSPSPHPEPKQVLMWEICKSEPEAAAEFDRTMEFIQKTIDTLKIMDAEGASWRTISGVMAFVRRAAIGLCLRVLQPLNPITLALALTLTLSLSRRDACARSVQLPFQRDVRRLALIL